MLKKISFGIVIILGFGLYALIPYSGGSPGGKTGSPGDGNTCTQCHSGTAVQQVSDWISGNIPEDGYQPGETYNLTVSGNHAGVSKFGFEITAEDAEKAKKGQFVITDSGQTKLANNNRSVTHTSSGNSPSGNAKSWSFDWIAPEAGTGEVTFFAALNAANGNNRTSGDVIYNTSLKIPENTGTGIDDIILANNIKVYQPIDPNLLIVKLPEVNTETADLKIYDLNGRLRIYEKINRIDPENYAVDINGLKSDIYLVQIALGNQIVNKKIIINK